MQMFVLDRSPIDSARFLCDAHVRVICREITMCLSAWYAHNTGHVDELPYKPFNHPAVWQFANPYTRRWAGANARHIFNEFVRRFGKVHASKRKLDQVALYMSNHDNSLFGMRPDDVYEHARFSFIEKGHSVVPELTIDEAVRCYRHYYRQKLDDFKVPVVYTDTIIPYWREYT